MEEKVVVEFINYMNQSHVDLEIPLEITANDLVLALNGWILKIFLVVIWLLKIQLRF